MQFGLLGRLDVRYGDTVLPVPSGKQRAILAVLLLRNGQVVDIDEMIELIWAGDPPRSARVTLYNHVRRLRQVLAGAGQALLQTHGSAYAIETAPETVDVMRFLTLCAVGRVAYGQRDWPLATARLNAALALWRGQPLMDIPCAPLTDTEVPYLLAMRLGALEDRIDADLRLGRHHEILPELRRLADTEPLREQVQSLYMLALYRSGRQADALEVYRKARAGLIGELGVEPGFELRRMHHRILNADPALTLAG
jgi:DNA-binding SARP family transcriptional activator